MKFRSITLLSLLVFAQSHAINYQKYQANNPQNITIIGTGYVGLISGAGLAACGHQVTCVDIIKEKVEKLNQGIMPIFEPGIQELVVDQMKAGRLSFTLDSKSAIGQADVIIIAVDTPMGEDGKADLRALTAVAKNIGANLNGFTVICTKSTVPLGTHLVVRDLVSSTNTSNSQFEIVSNPEFLREGTAIIDLFERNPIIVGTDSIKAHEIMQAIYQPIIDQGADFIATNNATAEIIKYAWNTFLGVRIAYVNELAELCNAAQADVFQVIHGMSLGEKVYPTSKLKPGPGIGGSCLPKDTQALVRKADDLGIDLQMVKAFVSSNKKQKRNVVQHIYDLLDGAVEGKTIAILGLAFKANTDDIRYSTAIPVINKLLADGAHVSAYDPAAMENMRQLYPDVTYCSTITQALKDADAVVLITEWDEFKRIDLAQVAQLVRSRNLFDGRNLWDPKALKALNFNYRNLGRA
ncbi:MAG: UDP-glucose/GDP-mannose dehydrogenase family protein [Candidatus Babeliales bacterium]